MTDQERARTFVVGLTPRGLIEAESLTAALLEEFEAVRDDERQTIAAWFLERTGMVGVAHLIATGEMT